jgi:hypothetical protein
MIYACIDDNNIVINLIIADEEFVKTLDGVWIARNQTDKDSPALGWLYDKTQDLFLPIKPHDNWLLDEQIWRYVPPTPYPTDGNVYSWNQTLMKWEKYVEEGAE